jgi:hypothetical protein
MTEAEKQYREVTDFDSQRGKEFFFTKSQWVTQPPQMNTGAITGE